MRRGAVRKLYSTTATAGQHVGLYAAYDVLRAIAAKVRADTANTPAIHFPLKPGQTHRPGTPEITRDERT